MGNTASKSLAQLSKRAIARPTYQVRPRIRQPYSAIHHDEELQRYTRGRFVWDEVYEMSRRCASFNDKALATIAAEAMGSSRCVSIEKLRDGNCNKALLLTMNDGAQAFAKIPYPLAGRPHLTVASEVATMDFARNQLHMPVPKVYASCSHRECNPVGVEYIIMEKAKGVLLETMLPEMDIKQRWDLAQAVTEYQLRWVEAGFQSYGSLYYRLDLPTNSANSAALLNSPEADMERFAIGPTTDRISTVGRKIPLDFDLGPWKTASDFFKATAHQEIASIKQIDKPPRSYMSVFGPGTYQPSKEKKLRAVQSYLDILPNLIPDDKFLLKPCLWHPEGLSAEKIFVNPEDPTEVTAIVDWQATAIAPLFTQVGKPEFLSHEGSQATGLERPCLPSNFEELPEMEKEQTEDLFFKQSLVVLYNTLVSKDSPGLWRAMEFEQTPEKLIMTVARIILIDGEAPLLKMILDFLEAHPKCLDAGGRIDDQARNRLLSLIRDRDIIQKDVDGAKMAARVMADIREEMGDIFDKAGRVSHDDYDETMEVLSRFKEQVFEKFARSEQDRVEWQKSWPFDH